MWFIFTKINVLYPFLCRWVLFRHIDILLLFERERERERGGREREIKWGGRKNESI